MASDYLLHASTGGRFVTRDLATAGVIDVSVLAEGNGGITVRVSDGHSINLAPEDWERVLLFVRAVGASSQPR